MTSRFLKPFDLIFLFFMLSILSLFLLLIFANGQFWPDKDLWHQDKITKLPGISDEKRQKVEQFAGYLDSSVDWRHFYWLIEADENPMKKPLIFWIGDGPGCSPLVYLFDSIGPYFLSEKSGKFWRNQKSWSRFANIVAMDTPVGVGYSYSKMNKTKTSDFDVMEQNFAFVQKFLEKHERFKNHDIYLSGVSYSGVMIPMLADKLLNETRIKLKGILIGNGMTDWELHNESILLFLYWHGGIDQLHWQKIQSLCCPSPQICHFSLEKAAKYSYECFKYISYYLIGIRQGPLNYYHLNGKCEETRKLSQLHFMPLCENAHYFIEYFNRKDVKKLLKIPENVQWQRCNQNLHVGTAYYQNSEKAMQSYVRRVANKNVKVLIYAGDSGWFNF